MSITPDAPPTLVTAPVSVGEAVQFCAAPVRTMDGEMLTDVPPAATSAVTTN
jgi:hypothetical protein